jgi:hypothetical protein
MNNRLLLLSGVFLWITCLCNAQETGPVCFEYVNGIQFSSEMAGNQSNTLVSSFTMAPGINYSDKLILYVPAKMNIYAVSQPQPQVSQDIMVGISAAYRRGSVDIEACHLFGLWYSDLGQMETGLSLFLNRGKNDRSSFYKIGVSYLTPYQKGTKGGLFISAGLGLRFSLAKCFD